MERGRKFTSIEEYHASIEDAIIRKRLEELRKAIHKAAPDAKETISYNMPAFKMKKVLVYYAAYKNHIGFYPTAEPMIVFANALQSYPTSKGAVQFLHTEKLPLDLIGRMVKYRIQQTGS
jgi:uncharacterized protein YdhG (YjbR/CyaY superfamily)